MSNISVPVVPGGFFSSARSARVHVSHSSNVRFTDHTFLGAIRCPRSPLPTLAARCPFSFLYHMIYPSIEERRLDWINYPCLTEDFSEQRADTVTGVAARPASKAAQAERRLAMTARSGLRLSLRRLKWPSTLNPCVSQTLRQRRPRPRPQQRPPSHMQNQNAEGERESGMTPYCAEGWQQANARVAMYYDEPGRSETTPIHLESPTRDKQA